MSSVYSNPKKSYFLPNFRSVQHRYGGCIPAYPMQASFIYLFFFQTLRIVLGVCIFVSLHIFGSALYCNICIWPGLKCSCSSISFADLLGKDVRPNWPGSKCAVLSFKGKPAQMLGSFSPWAKASAERVPTLASRKNNLKGVSTSAYFVFKIPCHTLDHPNINIIRASRIWSQDIL